MRNCRKGDVSEGCREIAGDREGNSFEIAVFNPLGSLLRRSNMTLIKSCAVNRRLITLSYISTIRNGDRRRICKFLC